MLESSELLNSKMVSKTENQDRQTSEFLIEKRIEETWLLN